MDWCTFSTEVSRSRNQVLEYHVLSILQNLQFPKSLSLLKRTDVHSLQRLGRYFTPKQTSPSFTQRHLPYGYLSSQLVIVPCRVFCKHVMIWSPWGMRFTVRLSSKQPGYQTLIVWIIYVTGRFWLVSAVASYQAGIYSDIHASIWRGMNNNNNKGHISNK